MNDQLTSSCAVLFPGQGSQEKGMGRDFAEASKEAMDMWKKAESVCGAALREIYWDGDAAAMAETKYLQPALTVVNVNLWAHIAGKLKGRCASLSMAGHSLGEFSALAAAEVLPVEKVLELVSLRGRLMAEADPEGKSTMAAVLKLPLEDVREIVEAAAEEADGILVVANLNSPAQYVISGQNEAVSAAEPLVKERKGRMIRLPVSGAFHSPYMQEAAAELAARMKKFSWNDAKFPIYMNSTASPARDAQAILEIMTGQMTGAVRWIEIIAGMYSDGARWFCEVGPKTVLTKLLKANLADKDEDWETSSVGSHEQAESI